MEQQVFGRSNPGEAVTITARRNGSNLELIVSGPSGQYSGTYYSAPAAGIASLTIRGSDDHETIKIEGDLNVGPIRIMGRGGTIPSRVPTISLFYNDTIYGGLGHDLIDGTKGNDLLYGEEDDDSINGGAGHDLLSGGQGNDRLVEFLGGRDTLQGNEGDDRLDAHLGRDILDGGPDTDILCAKDREPGDVLKNGETIDFDRDDSGHPVDRI